MKAPTILCVLLGVQLNAQQPVSPAGQVWKSKQGTTLNATLRGVDAGNVIFDMGGGNTRQVPLDALADEDQQRIKALLPRLITEALENSSERAGTWPARVFMNLEAANVRPSPNADANRGYTSAYFEISSDTDLTPATANEFAQVLESAHAVMRAAPWGVLATVPKGEKLKVRLCDRTGNISASGSGAYYERETRTLHVTLETAGLKYAGNNLVLDTTRHSRPLMRELAKMLTRDLEGIAPGWFVVGFPIYFERIPFRAGTFWTGIAERSIAEEIRATGKSPGNLAVTLAMNHDQWNGQSKPDTSGGVAPVSASVTVVTIDREVSRTPGVRPQPQTAVTPSLPQAPPSALEVAAHDAFLLCLHFATHEPERLGKFLKAVQKDKAAWDTYYAGVDQYRKDIAEFLKRPEVEKLPDGVFRYPSTLTPPKAPKPPHEVESPAVPFIHQPLLLDGRSLEQAEADAMKTLRAARIGG